MGFEQRAGPAQVGSGEVRRLGPPRMYSSFAPSPDGRFLLVGWLERPFSYTVPCGRFPKRVQLWDRRVRALLTPPAAGQAHGGVRARLGPSGSLPGAAV
jgi:hypothetical protein